MCHSSNFNAFFPVKTNKMWNFCLTLWFFRNCLLQRLETCSIGFVPLKPFWCIFPSQNQQNVKFWLFPELLLTKNEKKNINLNREKVFEKASKSAHIGFWVCQSQCTMLELCVTSTFWVVMVLFSFFTGRSRYRVLKHGVGVKWDSRRTAAYVPSHFKGF